MAAYNAPYPGDSPRKDFCKNLEWTKIYTAGTKKLYKEMTKAYLSSFEPFDDDKLDEDAKKFFKVTSTQAATSNI